MTVLVKKSAVRRSYLGGIRGFREDYPSVLEDGYLYGIVSMSGGGTQEILESLRAKGLHLESSCAVGDMFHGPIDNHPHFEFRCTTSDFPPQWEALLVSDSPEVMAEDGAALLSWLMKNNKNFEIPPSLLDN